MKKNIFAVCDLEAAYAYNLMEYMNIKQNTPFEVQAFTNVKSLGIFAKEHEIEMLLISSQAMCEEVKNFNIGRIMILSEGELIQELAEYPTVYKYQSSDNLIAEVMGYYANQNVRVNPLALLKKDVEVIGIYSPVKRTLKTSFALTLGQILAKKRAVLYLNLEDYAGFETLMGKEFAADIADLMYFVRQGSGNLIYKLDSMVQSIQNLDYIPPAFSPMDLRKVEYEEWMKLLGDIINFSSYDTIILDIGEQIDEVFRLLKQCRKIYMPVREDSVSLAKLDHYEKVLRMWDCEDIMERTRKLKLPFHSSFGPRDHYVEQLIWGELGDYVRKLISEEENDERGPRTVSDPS